MPDLSLGVPLQHSVPAVSSPTGSEGNFTDLFGVRCQKRETPSWVSHLNPLPGIDSLFEGLTLIVYSIILSINKIVKG